MLKDLDELDIEFNNRATEAFYLLSARFEIAVKELDRKKDENVFQHTRSKYMYSLKEELEKLAVTLIAKNQGLKEITQLNRNLTNRINHYVQEFMLKSQSL